MRTSRDLKETTSRFAVWSGSVALFSAALILSSLFLHRLFSIPTPVALNLLKLSILSGLFAIALGVLAMVDIWRNGSRGISRVFLGGLISLTVVAWPLLLLPRINSVPEINDVTTDTREPPPFETLAARRPPGANLSDYPGEVFASQQQQAFPDLKTLLINRSVAEAYEVSVDAIRRLGMNIVSSNAPGEEFPAEGLIEAYDRTLIWGFYDDVAVRVSGNQVTAQIDVRSASRYGRHDLGRNAERTRRLLREIVARLEATVSTPLARRARRRGGRLRRNNRR
jgi:uncharacterized protein DUF1499